MAPFTVWSARFLLILSILQVPGAISAARLPPSGLTFPTPRYLCIPTGASYIESHEGRHHCAYNATSDGGYRAVGVAYDLDQRPIADRKSELSTVLADYDQVYNGTKCLNDIQVTALLAMSVKRGFDEAAECVSTLDNFACDVQLVLLDLVFAKGKYWLCDQSDLIVSLTASDWHGVAKMLEETEWCKRNGRRCKDDVEKIRSQIPSTV